MNRRRVCSAAFRPYGLAPVARFSVLAALAPVFTPVRRLRLAHFSRRHGFTPPSKSPPCARDKRGKGGDFLPYRSGPMECGGLPPQEIPQFPSLPFLPRFKAVSLQGVSGFPQSNLRADDGPIAPPPPAPLVWSRGFPGEKLDSSVMIPLAQGI